MNNAVLHGTPDIQTAFSAQRLSNALLVAPFCSQHSQVPTSHTHTHTHTHTNTHTDTNTHNTHVHTHTRTHTHAHHHQPSVTVCALSGPCGWTPPLSKRAVLTRSLSLSLSLIKYTI